MRHAGIVVCWWCTCVVAVVVCGLVLLQHGKGADMGAAFGSGSSGSLFGAAGFGQFPVAYDGGAGGGVLRCRASGSPISAHAHEARRA